MNTDTPRTDAVENYILTRDDFTLTDHEVWLSCVKSLELEINANKARITRLKEAGGAMCRQLKDDRATENDWQERAIQAIENWKQALI